MKRRNFIALLGGAPAAVPKVGQCPSGWVQSGAYGLDARRR